MKAAASLLTIALLGLAGVALAKKWNFRNDPFQFQERWLEYSYKLEDLPLKGALDRKPWSDTYWPSYRSGIAHRWYSDNPKDFKYELRSLEQLQNLTLDQLKELSPAEKFDVFQGRYDYPTVQSEWKRTSPNDAGWEGICHGWAPAAYAYDEPNPVTLTGKDGLEIPFGSSDIKALLSYFAGQYDVQASNKFVGDRCNDDLNANPEEATSDACSDINAGTFFIVVANRLGKLKKGFVVDRDRSIQVWNQPVYSYEATFTGNNSNEVNVTFNLAYTVETQPEWEAHEPYIASHDYTFTLEISKGKIFGGHYDESFSDLSRDRIDFAWFQQISDFFGYFEPLKTIYEKSVNKTFILEEHSELKAFDNSFFVKSSFVEVEGSIGLEDYIERDVKTWTISPQTEFEVAAIQLDIFKLKTERYRETLRIYEGCGSELGPIIATYHGDYSNGISETIIGSCATVVFISEAADQNAEFFASYRAIPAFDI